MTPPPLFAMTPFALDRNLGAAYNQALEVLPADAWACFLDHDAMYSTRHWYAQLVEAIAFLPEAGAFVATCNRIGAYWQQTGDKHCHDIAKHRQYGEQRRRVRTLLDVTETKGFGGVAFALSKAAWREVGGFRDGLLCVDHAMHFALRDRGRRIYLLEGLYVYHWRRAFGDELPEDTPRVPNCPCRGPEPPPMKRIALP